jgi:hypothetical protein
LVQLLVAGIIACAMLSAKHSCAVGSWASQTLLLLLLLLL